jgi:hypothetical protein
MKTYLKLIGPSIDKGIDALEKKLNELKKLDKQHLYGDIIYHAISKLVPSYAGPGTHQTGGRCPPVHRV